MLTGWTVDRPQRGGGFQFDPNRHEPGTKNVMGAEVQGTRRRGRPRAAAHARHAAGDGAVHLAQAGGAVCQRRSAAGAGGPHGEDVLSQRRRHSAVLSTLFHSPEFWDASDYRAKVKTPIEFVVSAARASERGHREPAAAGQCAAPDGHAALWMRAAQWLQLDGGSVGEHRRAGGPHEFCVVAGGKPAAGHLHRVGADRKRAATTRRCWRRILRLRIRRQKSAAWKRCSSQAA